MGTSELEVFCVDEVSHELLSNVLFIFFLSHKSILDGFDFCVPSWQQMDLVMVLA